MFAIVKEMLSPFAFITIKKNVNGRYNKFYSTDGKFYSYRAHGRYFIKHKRYDVSFLLISNFFNLII